MRLLAVFALIAVGFILAAAILTQPQWNWFSVILGLGLSVACIYWAMRLYKGVSPRSSD